MPFAPTPASFEKFPSTYKLVPSEASPFTTPFVMPGPGTIQLLPSHFATPFTAAPPAFVKCPAAYTVSCTTANALADVPANALDPKVDQKTPSHAPTPFT